MHLVKNFDPKIPIISGGYHPTGAPELILNELKCDAICRGEGELLFREFVQGVSWEEIKGLSYRLPQNGKEIFTNPDRPFMSGKDLDNLPFPARDLRKRRGYRLFAGSGFSRECRECRGLKPLRKPLLNSASQCPFGKPETVNPDRRTDPERRQ